MAGSRFRWRRSSDRESEVSVFFREYITQPDSELRHHRFQFVEGEVMFAPLNPVQRGVGDAGFPAELGIRHLSPRFSQELCQLDIHAFSHPQTVANLP